MSDYGTKPFEGFAKEVLKWFYERSIGDTITNDNYQGEIDADGGKTKVNVMGFKKLAWGDYTGADLVAQAVEEVIATLDTDQQKGFYFKVKSIDQLHSWIKNPDGTIIQQLGDELKKIVDTKVLGMYADVAAGNRIGTDYTTGTVAVANTTGVVTGSGTTFTPGMVGKGFKATGHTKWYRVKTYTSATEIVIENDSDDETSAYDGGAITAGATYIVQANTCVTLTKSTIYANLVQLKEILDDAQVPDTDRYITVPTKIQSILLQAPELIPAVATAYDEVVKKGLLGEIAGFKAYRSVNVAGDNTNGYHVIANHKSWQTKAEAMNKNEEEPFIPGNFGQGYKGLYVYGVKVPDIHRGSAAELFCKV